jgi:23S rRNA C2498 (ribose-2'-O)-methylase RlmM
MSAIGNMHKWRVLVSVFTQSGPEADKLGNQTNALRSSAAPSGFHFRDVRKSMLVTKVRRWPKQSIT